MHREASDIPGRGAPQRERVRRPRGRPSSSRRSPGDGAVAMPVAPEVAAVREHDRGKPSRSTSATVARTGRRPCHRPEHGGEQRAEDSSPKYGSDASIEFSSCRCAAVAPGSITGPTMSGTLSGRRTIALNPASATSERSERGRAERRHDRLIRAAGPQSGHERRCGGSRERRARRATSRGRAGRARAACRCARTAARRTRPPPRRALLPMPLIIAVPPRRRAARGHGEEGRDDERQHEGERSCPSAASRAAGDPARPRRRRGRSGTRPARQ